MALMRPNMDHISISSSKALRSIGLLTRRWTHSRTTMLQSTFALILRIFLSLALILLIMLVSFKSFIDREKLSPFECGFDPKSSARLPFSLRFFLLAVIFLVFDVEIALLLPLPLALHCPTKLLLISSAVFLIILILGVLHEWNQGSLDW